MSDHSTTVPISFGDCDPAGIVFYPNTYRWFDRAFHEWLRPLGGHAQICKQLGAIGAGLIEADAQFHYPMRDGDTLTLNLSVEQWSKKTLRLSYEGLVGATLCLTGHEVRALFRHADAGMVAADISEFRNLVESLGKQG